MGVFTEIFFKTFLQVEVTSIRDSVLNTPNIQAFIDVHSYSQMLFYPWGYTLLPAADKSLLVSKNYRLNLHRTKHSVRLKLKVLSSSVSGKDLTIIEVSVTGLNSSVQLYNARCRQCGTEYSF